MWIESHSHQTAPAPAVSVIMPCYRAVAFIAETLESLAAQNFTDWELIAVEDGLADGTEEIVRSFADRKGGLPPETLIQQTPLTLTSGRVCSCACARASGGVESSMQTAAAIGRRLKRVINSSPMVLVVSPGSRAGTVGRRMAGWQTRVRLSLLGEPPGIL